MISQDDLAAVSLAELLAANNWQNQYRLITQWGKLIQPKPEMRKPEYLLRGCETPAWLAHGVVAGRHRFSFDSDSRVINGLAALMLAQIDDKTSLEIETTDFTGILTAAGLEKHLTPSRNNGLRAIMLRAQQLVADVAD